MGERREKWRDPALRLGLALVVDLGYNDIDQGLINARAGWPRPAFQGHSATRRRPGEVLRRMLEQHLTAVEALAIAFRAEAECEVLARYPRYFEQALEPRRPEFRR